MLGDHFHRTIRCLSYHLSKCRGVRRTVRRLSAELLEERRLLDCQGFAGNANCPNLNLTAIGPQTAVVGTDFILSLPNAGATVVDLDANGMPTGDVIRWALDPDIPQDTPLGATISPTGVFRWTPTASQIGTHEIVVLVIDRGSPPLADAEVLTIVVRGQAPLLDLNGEAAGTDFSATYTEDDPPVLIVSPNLTISDPDSTTMASATASITNLRNGAQEILSVVTTGTNITAVYDAPTGTLTLTGVDTLTNYQTVLRTLRYVNTSQNPDTTSRRIEIRVNDGGNNSNTAIATVQIVSVNDAPNLESIADIQIELGQPLEVTVRAVDVEGDALTFILDRNDPNSTIPASATITRIDAESAVIRWTADATGTFRFVVLVIDDAAEPLADRETFLVTVVDLRPVVDLNGADVGIDFSATFTPGGPAVTIASADLTITSPVATELQSATVSITNLLDGPDEELLVDTSGSGLTHSYNPATGVLTISGLASLERYTQALRSVEYRNRSSSPTITTRILEVIVSAGTRTSLPARSRVTIQPIALRVHDGAGRPDGHSLVKFAVASARQMHGSVRGLDQVFALWSNKTENELEI